MRDITYRVVVDTGNADTNIRRVEQSFQDVGRTASRELEGVDKNTQALIASTDRWVKTAAGLASVVQIYSGLRGAVGELLTSYGAVESASVKLTQALQTQGSATPAIIKHYGDLATQFQRTTTFADELVIEMQALLVQVGNVGPAQMEKALKAATDLSAGLGVDLRTATMLVAKAFAGNTDTLGRYGIVLDETAKKADPTAAALEAINAKFGGQAQAALDTYQGKMALVNNQLDDGREAMGELAAKGLSPMLDLFARLPKPVQATVATLQSLAPNLESVLLGVLALGGPGKAIAMVTGAFTSMAGFITGTVLPLISTALPFALRGLAALFSFPAGLVVAAIAGVVTIWKHWDTIGPIVQKVYTAVKEWLVDKFTAVVDRIKGAVDSVTGFFRDMYDKVAGRSYVPDMVNIIAQQFGRLSGVMIDPTRRATMDIGDSFGALQDRVSGILGQLQNRMSGTVAAIAQGAAQIYQSFRGGSGGGGVNAPYGSNIYTDALGVAAATTKNKTVSYAASGAAIGSMIMPGWGTAVGAGVGALVGLFRGGDEKKVNQLRDAYVQAAGGIQRLEAAAKTAGVTLDKFLDAKKPKDYEKAVTDLNNALAFQDEAMARLKAATEKYGFTLEQLGPALQRQELGKQAEELLTDFSLLTAAGVDQIAITDKMSEAVNHYVQNAIKMGIEVPEAMRPMLQQFVDAGKLYDANGQQIQTLETGNIKFAKTATQAMQDLQKVIEKLTDAIGRGLKGAIESVPSQKTTKFRAEYEGFPGGGGFDPAAAAAGGYTGGSFNPLADGNNYHAGGVVLPFVARAHQGLALDEVPIIALRGEGVLNRRAMRRLGGAPALNALNSGQAGMGGAVINNVTVNVDGDINSPMARRKLASVVRQELDQEYRMRRKASLR